MKKGLQGLLMMAIGLIAIIALVFKGKPIYDIAVIWFFVGMAWSLLYSFFFFRKNEGSISKLSNIILMVLPLVIGVGLIIVNANASAYYATAGLLVLTLLIKGLQKKAKKE